MCSGPTRRPATRFNQIRRPPFSATHATERSNRVFVHTVCAKDDKVGSEIALVLACLQENAKVGIKKWGPKFLFEIRFMRGHKWFVLEVRSPAESFVFESFAVDVGVIICRLRFQSLSRRLSSASGKFLKAWSPVTANVTCSLDPEITVDLRSLRLLFGRKWRQGRDFIFSLAASI